MIPQLKPPGPASISLQTLLPELLRTHPHARDVLNRYGLRGCGGPNGPVETIQFFARAHGVPEQKLLNELNVAALLPATPDMKLPVSSVSDTIYRRFFTAGIILILTFGATWGAWLLWRIGFAGNFTGVSIHEVNAHGHAQIFGWVGLFMMGFAYQAFPRIWHSELAVPKLAVAAFLSMAAGIVIRTIGMTLAQRTGVALPMAMVGAALELAAILTFVTQLLATFWSSDQKVEPYVGFVITALVWFIVMAFFDAWHTYVTMTAASRDQLLWYVATYQAPFRDLQIHGLALFMILGVCTRMLPALYGVSATSSRRLWIALGVLTVAVIGESALFIVYRKSGIHGIAALLMIPWIMLAVGVAMVVLPWKLWRRFEQSDRSTKFVRTAYVWLAVSLTMLLLLPVYQAVSGIPFSHAYYGSIRHAITVGFISLMIMGFAAKVVPTLNGVDICNLSPLWGPYLLVNIGCFLRVSTQTLSDWHRGFFAIVGLSGTLEVLGLAWWGFGLISIMRRGKLEMAEVGRDANRPRRITGDQLVANVIDWFPVTQEVFDQFGFSLLRSSFLRQTLARNTTLAQAAAFRRISLVEFLEALNAAIGPSAGARSGKSLSLPVITLHSTP